MRMWKRVFWLTLLLKAIWGCASAPFVEVDGRPSKPIPSMHLIVDRNLIGQVVFLHYKMGDEFMGCVFGRIEGDTIFAYTMSLMAVDPRQSNPWSVGAGDCAKLTEVWDIEVIQIGLIHNHPGMGFDCQPSELDSRVLRESPFFVGMITCNQGLVLSAYDKTEKMVLTRLPSLNELYSGEN